MEGKPTLTLHQYNAQAMYSKNNTIAFMNALFEQEDHEFIMREARIIDAGGLEKKRRITQTEFCLRLAATTHDKDKIKRRKAVELQEKLKGIPLILSLAELDAPPTLRIDSSGAKRWIGRHYNAQLDALRFRSVPGIPSKSKLYLDHISEHRLQFGASLDNSSAIEGPVATTTDWYEEEDEEMEES
ncbi:hypothetical protein BDP27DRAFT_1376809 [Rhodocollybia butyracea]|uniref:Uncharacterized protein n=1 Tax=Rhodocollybia butyracea TaxID=206335 RepID=A0A9P5P6B2_9AGAR|nr:hypothetical protein BDP27DRAFT_1376809 [Rhodocollybia butyracea]